MDININHFATELLIIAAFISAIGGAVAVIKKWIKDSKPSKHDEIIREQGEQIKRLNERVTVLESNNKMSSKYINAMCGAMLALLDHNINGDSIDKLKEAKEEMKEFLIYRG